MATSLALWATGVLDLGQALAGFGDPAVVFIASLFVVSAGLEATGVTAWIGQFLIRQAGESRVRLLVLTMLLVSVLTALINLNGSVAALLPVVVVMAVRLGRPPVAAADAAGVRRPCRLAAGAHRHAGERAGLRRRGRCRPGAVRLSSSSPGSACRCCSARWRSSCCSAPACCRTAAASTIPADLSKHARTLIEHYTLDDGVFQLRVRSDLALCRRARADAVDLVGLSGRQPGGGAGRRRPAARCDGRRWPRATS